MPAATALYDGQRWSAVAYLEIPERGPAPVTQDRVDGTDVHAFAAVPSGYNVWINYCIEIPADMRVRVQIFIDGCCRFAALHGSDGHTGQKIRQIVSRVATFIRREARWSSMLCEEVYPSSKNRPTDRCTSAMGCIQIRFISDQATPETEIHATNSFTDDTDGKSTPGPCQAKYAPDQRILFGQKERITSEQYLKLNELIGMATARPWATINILYRSRETLLREQLAPPMMDPPNATTEASAVMTQFSDVDMAPVSQDNSQDKREWEFLSRRRRLEFNVARLKRKAYDLQTLSDKYRKFTGPFDPARSFCGILDRHQKKAPSHASMQREVDEANSAVRVVQSILYEHMHDGAPSSFGHHWGKPVRYERDEKGEPVAIEVAPDAVDWDALLRPLLESGPERKVPGWARPEQAATPRTDATQPRAPGTVPTWPGAQPSAKPKPEPK
ncbi:MAG: hypothetical protein Q9162_005690 [Coniocarpon cinnabarinum]